MTLRKSCLLIGIKLLLLQNVSSKDDYEDTFSQIVKLATIRVVLAISVYRGVEITAA
jgi:hypothetical protein